MKRNKRGRRWMILGLCFLAAASGLGGYNLWDAHRAEKSADRILEQMKAKYPVNVTAMDDVVVSAEKDQEIEIPDYLLNPDMEMPVSEIDGQDYIGVLEIPSLDLSLPVLSEWSYPALKLAPCRYEGSAYKDHLIIAAHNYESHFGKLHTLGTGDPVCFTDMEGNVFSYEVVMLETVMATDIVGMTEGDWDLTLFTCTYGGQQRTAVRCERIQNSTLMY